MTAPARIKGEWLHAPSTVAVMDALMAEGGAARFVGGCVRNSLIGRPVADIDIATPLLPQAVVARVKAAGLRAVATGLKHGTITAVAGGEPFEITTLRHDVETDGRHASVTFTDDWVADAARRDFTMNALYCDRDGTLYAPVGGVDDALAGRVVFVGKAEDRIREDYLRILRYYRFLAWYGQGEPDAEALAACTALKPGLVRLSAERVGREVMKLLAAPDPGPAVVEMAAAGVLHAVLPPVPDTGRVPGALGHMIVIEQALDFNPGPLRRLVALTGGRVEGLRDILRLSNNQAVHIAAVAALAPLISAGMTTQAARILIYRNGRAVWRDAVVAAWAGSGAGMADPDWTALAGLAQWDPPAFPLRGRDLEARGIPPGPALGGKLKDLERHWIETGFTLDRAALLSLV